MKLSDTQLCILQTGAADRERRCHADAKLGAAPRAAIAKKLVSLGLVIPCPCPADTPKTARFPSSAKPGARAMTLHITDPGLRALGIEPKADAEPHPISMTEEERADAAEAEEDAGAAEAVATAPRGADPATDGVLAAKAEARARAEKKAAERAAKQAARAEAYARRAAEAGAEARSGRGFWRAAEEAASRGELPPAPDFSAPTHAPYRKKLEKLLALAQAGDAAGLRAAAINPTSTSPKTLIRWRDLAVRAIEAREGA